MIVYTHTYTVSGTGRFPVDMLRYDRSHPANETVSYRIEAAIHDPTRDGRTTVVLERNGEKQWKAAAARWNSFGWRVDEHYSRRVD